MQPSRSILFFAPFLALAAGPGLRPIPLAELEDRIRGGWAGQMIGVSYGAPTEFRFRGRMNLGELPKWTPDRVSNALDQDDLYVDMTLAKVLDEKGLNATSEDFGAMLRDAQYRLWHANLAARRGLKRGVPARLTGTPRYNAHANDIDFQIEADFIGLMAPGLFRASNEIAWRAGRVMNYGDGIYGGMFISGMYAAAFFESDRRKVVEAGLACIPKRSPYALLIADVLAWHAKHPSEWQTVWQLLEEKWDRRDPCPEGALRPFNIDAKLNGGYVALGVLFGDGDFGRTIEVATRAGQDSDCNPASAGGILGVMIGWNRIPEEYKGGIPPLADKKFNYTDFSLNTIVESTKRRAIKLAQATGGRVQGDRLLVRIQTPRAPKLEIWDDYGKPAERIDASDARWSWSGPWQTSGSARLSSERGAEAAIRFEGTGAIVVGGYYANGGKADVYLDGKLHRTVDVYSDEQSNKSGEAVWHAFGLKNSSHTLRLVVRGETYPGSSGVQVGISDLVVFRP